MLSKCNERKDVELQWFCAKENDARVRASRSFVLNLISAITCSFIVLTNTSLAADMLHQPTWGRPKETRPRPAAPVEEEPIEEDEIGDPDAPRPVRGTPAREAKVSEAGAWKDGDPERKKPTEECQGDVWYAATSTPADATKQGGVRYLWVTPAEFSRGKSYDLVVILHPSQNNVFWGMHTHANSDPETGERFRPDQIVVSVDGLTVTGTSAERRSFVVGPDTLAAFRDVMLELSQSFPIRRMYLYGSESGADFAVAFSQRFPALVDGVVAYRASAAVLPLASKGRMPLVFVHGAKDSVLPLAVSLANHRAFVDAGHAGVRLRILPEFNDFPNAVCASECIDWMLAMNARGDGAPEEALHAVRAILKPKQPDEFDYVGPVWFSGAYEALSRITGTPEGGVVVASDGETPTERLWRSLGASGKSAKDVARGGGGGGGISDETLAAASTLQGQIETHALRHIAEIQKITNPDASGAAPALDTGALPAPDGSPAAAWLWHLRQDFRGVTPVETFIAAMGYDEAVKTHIENAREMNKALRRVREPEELIEIATEWVGRVYLAPTLPISVKAAAQQIAQNADGGQPDLAPEVQESLEMVTNVDRTWAEGAKAYRKIWSEWGGQHADEEEEESKEE